MSMEHSSDNTGNRNRDLPACSAVPQPTAPPLAPLESLVLFVILCLQLLLLLSSTYAEENEIEILSWILQLLRTEMLSKSCRKFALGCRNAVSEGHP